MNELDVLVFITPNPHDEYVLIDIEPPHWCTWHHDYNLNKKVVYVRKCGDLKAMMAVQHLCRSSEIAWKPEGESFDGNWMERFRRWAFGNNRPELTASHLPIVKTSLIPAACEYTLTTFYAAPREIIMKQLGELAQSRSALWTEYAIENDGAVLVLANSLRDARCFIPKRSRQFKVEELPIEAFEKQTKRLRELAFSKELEPFRTRRSLLS